MRLFIAIPLAESVRAELVRWATRLRAVTSLRWSAPESWHITLQFLGSASEDQYRCLIARLSGIHAAPFSIRLAGLGVFDRAGIFHAEVELTPALTALQRRVTAATAPCGFEPETRPYHPHITLARSKGSNRARALRVLQDCIPPKPGFPAFAAPEFLLYESHLSPAGSTYEVRHRFPLTPNL